MLDDTFIDPSSGPVIGLYSASEWIHARLVLDAYAARTNVIEVKNVYITSIGFNFSEWVKRSFTHFVFTADDTCVVRYRDEGLLFLSTSKGKIEVRSVGTPKFCQELEVRLHSEFKKAENLIRWVYNGRGDDISVPLNYRPALQSAYPWIKQPLNEYIQSYLDSEASVLILIGPPGTGKTTFIKNIIHQSKAGARVAYDEKVLGGDDFFAMFIDGVDDILVMEDADSFLASRQDGNTMMHKFLNVSDGLISSVGKKLIFSTNLPNISDIDSALTRTGRCFDVLQFRPLTRTEAMGVLAEAQVDLQLPNGSDFTLAEIFTQQPSGNTTKRTVGFI